MGHARHAGPDTLHRSCIPFMVGTIVGERCEKHSSMPPGQQDIVREEAFESVCNEVDVNKPFFVCKQWYNRLADT